MTKVGMLVWFLLCCGTCLGWSTIYSIPSPLRLPQHQNVDDAECRRRALIVSALGITLVPPCKSNAAEPTSAGEAIRRSAANIPGYGQTDVFFPPSFSGKWMATRTLVSAADPSLQTKLPLTIEHEMRFIQSVDDDAVVADRGYNQVALEQALDKALSGNGEQAVRDYEWSAANPNDLRVLFADGSRTETKVTKRATERTEDTVSSSEIQRITLEDSSTGIPVISAHRVLQKWKVVDSDRQVEGIEIVYELGTGLSDPRRMSLGSSSTPQIVGKSRLSLSKIGP